VRVRLWAAPGNAVAATIREVSPVADPATRTYPFKVTLPATLTQARLGMTAVVQFASKTAQPKIKVPLSALFHERNATSVWVVEQGAVKLVPVRVVAADGNDLVLEGGVRAGQTVVTAGVHLLKPGQKVRILGDDVPKAPASGPAPAPAAVPAPAPAKGA
jgi:multidrug efflux system membrane fusion protein